MTGDISDEQLTKAQKTLIDFHEKFELFKGMTKVELLSVVEKVWFIKLNQGEKVFSKNHTGKEVFYIIDGVVSIMYNEETKVARLKKKTFFGEMAFITKKPRNASAFIESPEATILVINIKEGVEPSNPHAFSKLFHNMSEVLVKKVEAMNKKLSLEK